MDYWSIFLKLRKTLEDATGLYISLNRGYDLRKELLAHFHKNNDEVLKQLRRRWIDDSCKMSWELQGHLDSTEVSSTVMKVEKLTMPSPFLSQTGFYKV